MRIRKTVSACLLAAALGGTPALQAQSQAADPNQPEAISVGSVGDFQVVTSPDRRFGLDPRAIEAAKRWRFVPARQAVSVQEFEAGAYRDGAPGVVPPRVRREVRPIYTSAALRAKLQGIVGIDVVVMPDGTVDRARVVDSLDPALGLDAAAMTAARRWTFEPGSGTLNDQAVPVIVRLKLEFRIH
jgi:TonB family protein